MCLSNLSISSSYNFFISKFKPYIAPEIYPTIEAMESASPPKLTAF